MYLEDELHYNLDFLNPGNTWRPLEDGVRITKYLWQQLEFELIPRDYLDKIFGRSIIVFGDYGDFAESTRLLGYPRLLTLKTVDMVMGQPPLISAENNENMTQKIRDIQSYSQLVNAVTQGLIDYSRFGVCLLRIFKDENGQAQITSWNPKEWVPVFYNDGTHRIKYNVIGWIEDDKLHVQIHDTKDGSYEERVMQLIGGNIIGPVISSKRYNKTSGKKLLYAIINTPTTTNPLGTSDYEIINVLVQKAIERLMGILRVLDEHADPSMIGPHSLLEKQQDGQFVFKTSKYYAVSSEEMKPEYLVWDANLESSFKAFEELCKQIYVLSEMGEAFLGASNGVGNVVSGTAMRFKMISPLEKARRINNTFTRPLQEIISSMLMISGENVEAKDINIAWRDSLPKDPREVAELAKLEAGSVAIKPLLNAIMDNYNIDEKTATAYVQKILEEQRELKAISSNDNDQNLHPDGDSRSNNGNLKVDNRIKGSQMDPRTERNFKDKENNLK